MKPANAAADDAAFDAAWRRFRLLAVAVTLAVLAGSVAVALVYATRSGDDTPSELKPRALPNDHLTGVGATPARFRATHGPAREHNGFGQIFVDKKSGGVTAAYNVGNSLSPDIVDTLIHSFPAGTSETSVLAAVRADDLPPDARLVGTTAPDNTCKVLTYRSKTVAQSGPHEDFGDGTVRVTLYSALTGAYSASDVQQAYEMIYPTVGAECD